MSKITKVFKTFPPEQQGDFLIVLDDHGYNEVSMEFEAYECIGQDVMENGIITMPWAYERAESQCSPDFVGDHREAQVFASGFLKHTGCINFKFHEPEDTGILMHCCGLEDTRKFSRLFEKLYKIAPECIERWDGD